MLGNEEKIEGLNLADTFAGMLRELPWNGLKDYLQANAQVLKRCTAGGHRLEAKLRKRFEKILLKEAEKADFSQNFCSGPFAQWYPVHAELHKALEDYFHSDEYKAHREKEELDEDTYVLPDDMFAKFFDVKDLPKWRTILCFSPLQFTAEQADRLINNEKGDDALLEQLTQLEEELGKLRKQQARQENENTDLRGRLEQLTAEAQELRTERKSLRKERDGLVQKFETSQAENRRLRDQREQKDQALDEHRETTTTKFTKAASRLKNDLGRAQNTIEGWRSRYEKQCDENRELTALLHKTERGLSDETKTHELTQAELAHTRQFVEAVLDQIDWIQVGSQLHLTPQLKLKFNSLIKKLRYDADRSLTLDGTLENFWSMLQKEETDLVHAISQSDTLEVQSGDVEAFWLGLTDMFEDVYISLEARQILLKTLQEIFYQIVEIEDLEEGTLPGTRPKKRTKAAKA